MWQEEECYPSEPVFVPTPGATGEDDGRIIFSHTQKLEDIAHCDLKDYLPCPGQIVQL